MIYCNRNVWKLVGIIISALFFYNQNLSAQSFTKEDTSKVSLLINTAIDSIPVNAAKALYMAAEAVQISKDVNYKAGISKGLIIAGNACRQMGNINRAVNYFEAAIIFAQENNYKSDEARAQDDMGDAYRESGDYKKAFEDHSAALKINEKIPDSLGIANSYSHIGADLFNMKYYNDANKYYFLSIGYFNALNKPLEVAQRCGNIASVYRELKNYPLAFKYLFQSIHISDSLQNNSFLDGVYLDLGSCYLETGHADSAIYYYLKSLSASKETGNQDAQLMAMNNLGEVYLSNNKQDDAEKYFKESLDLAQRTSNKAGVYEVATNLAKLYAQKTDYADAYQYRLTASTARDSLMNQEKVKALAELTTRFETNEAEQENQTLQKENDLQKLRLRQKDYLMLGTGLFAIVLIIFALLLVRQNRLRARQQSLELERKQLLAQMNPHFIFNCLNSIQHFMAHNDVMNANKYLTEFASLMRRTLDSSSSSNITLQNELDYLQNYLLLEQMRFENKFSYELECDSAIDTEAVEIPTMIVQPFAENAIKHGLQYLENKEGKLKISFRKKNNSIILEIDDNGIGREQSRKLKSHSHDDHHSRGMELTQQRLDLISRSYNPHYKIEVIDKKNENDEAAGTKVIIQLPLQV